jgi:hypothetical protein
MAKQILGPLTSFKWNATDLSDHVRQITIEDSADVQEVTGFGEVYKEYGVGLKDATITAEFIQDYAASSVDAVIGAAYYAGVAGTIKVNADTSGTVVYTMIGKAYTYGPVSGGPGDVNAVSVTFHNAGTAGLTRGTA